jgi:16S rRNA G1207 methylase RsmC
MKAQEIICSGKRQPSKSTRLSANNVTKRVSDWVDDTQSQLKEKCRNFVAYSTATDESTDVKDITQLLISIRDVNKDFQSMEGVFRTSPS